MRKNRGKAYVGLAVLVALIFSAVMAFSAMSGGVIFAKGPKHHKPTPTPVHHKPKPTPTRPPTGNTTDFTVPQGSDPWGTAFDSHGNVWVALPDCDPGPYCTLSGKLAAFPGYIGEFNPSSKSWTKFYQAPAQPLFLAFDKSGNLWFTMPMTNSLGELVLSTNTINQWALPTQFGGAWDLAIDGNGMIWVTEHYTNKIAEFNPSTHKFVKEVATLAANSQPYGITVDHSNNVWFTENNSSVALIAEYTTGGHLNEYKIRNTLPSNLTPHLITVDGSGNIWWSEGWVSSIGKLVVSQAKSGTNSGVTEYTYKLPCSTCGSHTSGIAIDHSGKVWFDDSLQGIFGSFNGSFTVYNIPTAGGHAHDGLNVDSSNVVWFNEEFANKLARHS